MFPKPPKREKTHKPMKRKRMRRGKPDPAGITWAREIEKRAGGICQRCKSRPGAHAHHIASRARRPDLILDPSNAAWLCEACHSWVHSNIAEATAKGWLSTEKYEKRL